jgi:hypothetical protein
VVQAIRSGLLETRRAGDWGLDKWPSTGVTTLNPFTGSRSAFSITAELINENNIVIGRQTFQASGSWDWELSRWVAFSGTYYDPRMIVRNDNKNTVAFSVKVDDITDNLTIRIATVNGTPAEVASRNGDLQIVAMSGEEYTENNRMVLNFGAINASNIGGSNYTNLVIPETIWGELVTSIGDYSFQYFGQNAGISNRDNSTQISLTIPDSVTYIGGGAFTRHINNIIIGENVTFGQNAFDSGSFGEFPAFYRNNGRKAGTYYTTTNGQPSYSLSYRLIWNYTPR